jgi:hypothetical protein
VVFEPPSNAQVGSGDRSSRWPVLSLNYNMPISIKSLQGNYFNPNGCPSLVRSWVHFGSGDFTFRRIHST